MSGPAWVKSMTRSGRPVDHLALQEPGLRMANRLLPGITNGTVRARNYTIAAWITTQATTPEKIRSLETAVIHAASRHSHVDPELASGVIGINTGKKTDAATIDLGKHPNVSVLGAPFYGPSAYRLGVVGKRPTGAYGPSDDPLGRELGQLGPLSDQAAHAIAGRTVDAADLGELEALCPCQLPAGREQELLIDILFRFTRRSGHRLEEDVDAPRRNSLGLILQQVEAGLWTPDLILENLVAWKRGLPHTAAPSDHFKRSASGFAILGIRSIFKRALETLWCGVMHDAHEQNDGLIDVDGFVSRILESDPEFKSKMESASSLVTLIESFSQVQLIESELSGIRTRDLRKRKRRLELCGLAYKQLLTILATLGDLIPREKDWSLFITDGGIDRVSLSEFHRFSALHTSVRNWMEEAVGRYAIRQHLRTAAGKWQREGADGAFLTPESHSLQVLESGLSIAPAGNPTKISSALSLMSDLSLWSLVQSKSALNKTGLEVLEKIYKLTFK